MNDEHEMPAFESAADFLKRADQLPPQPDQESNGHHWWEASGTADECRNCELTRFHIDDWDCPTRRGSRVLFGTDFETAQEIAEPVCVGGLVYFIGPSRAREVKIGFTRGTAEKRCAELQTGNPRRLVVIATLRGSEQLERDLHRRFSTCRLEGEWFDRVRGGELDLYIKRLTRKAR